MLPILEAGGADALLAGALEVVALARLMQCDFAEMRTALEQALVHARRAGKQRDVTEILLWIPLTLHHGPAPVADGIARCDEILADPNTSNLAAAGTLAASGLLTAMGGNLVEGRARMARARGPVRGLGHLRRRLGLGAGALRPRVAGGRSGRRGQRDGGVVRRADPSRREGVPFDSGRLARSRPLPARQIRRGARGRRGGPSRDRDRGRRLEHHLARLSRPRARGGAKGRRGAAIGRRVRAARCEDGRLSVQHVALEARADVLLALGRPSEAHSSLADALALHRRKGNVLSVERTATRLERAGD